MKAKFVLLAVIVGALVAPINAYAESTVKSSSSHVGVAGAIILGIILVLILIPNKKKVSVESEQGPVWETKKPVSPLSIVPKQEPIITGMDEPGCIDGVLQPQVVVAKTVVVAPETEPIPAENSNVPAQASIPYLENPTVQELREIAAKMDIYFIPFRRTIFLGDSEITGSYKCIAVFDGCNAIPVVRQIPRVLLEDHISSDQGYVLRSSLLNWTDLPHELRNILLKAQEVPTSETITA